VLLDSAPPRPDADGTVGSYIFLPVLFSGYPVFMASKSIKVTPKRRDRPSTGGQKDGILVRLEADQFDALDVWIDKQSDQPTRPEAIRRLVTIGLSAGGSPQAKRTSQSTADRAAELAGNVIESRLAADATTEERATRKRRLVKGPSSFRDIRKDHPKKRP
jgi:hypothetical protein